MIKQPWLLVVAGIALVVFLYFVVDRLSFLSSALRTTGRVTHVTAKNGRCGSKSTYDCTKFQAEVTYRIESGAERQLFISAGSRRGHRQPTSLASRPLGSSVKVVCSPDGSRAYEDTLFGVWAAPIIALFVQLGALFTSMTEPKRSTARRRY